MNIYKLIDWNYVLIRMNRKKESDRTKAFTLRAWANTQQQVDNVIRRNESMYFKRTNINVFDIKELW